MNIARGGGAPEGAAASAPAPAPASKSTRRSNPFGDAKPVDTLQKELAVEEKLLANKPSKAEPAASQGDAAAAPEDTASTTAAPLAEDPADAAANKFAGLAIEGEQ